LNPTARDPVIVLAPIGDFHPNIINLINRPIRQAFGYTTEIRSLLDGIEFAFNPQRRQYHSTPILEHLAKSAPAHAVKVLGIVSLDLFIPILTHVYGEAQLNGKAAVVSIYRLKEGLPRLDPEKAFMLRIIKEAIHELGHTFDLRHCPDHACIMHYCRSEKDVDRKSNQLCRYCRTFVDDEIKRLAVKYPVHPAFKNPSDTS